MNMTELLASIVHEDMEIDIWRSGSLPNKDENKIWSFKEHNVKVKDANLFISITSEKEIYLGHMRTVHGRKVISYGKPFGIAYFQRQLVKFLNERPQT